MIPKGVFKHAEIRVRAKRGVGAGVGVGGGGRSLFFFFFRLDFQHHRSFVGQLKIKANIKKLSL